MKTVKLNLFWFFSFFLIAETFLAILLAIFGIFNQTSLLLTAGFLLLFFFWLFKKRTFQKERMDRFSLIVLSVIFLEGLFLSWFSSPTVFGGRDEGSYSNSAILLTQEGKLFTSSTLIKEFEKIYKEGKALNFPGFYYQESGQLKSQFLPAYPVWLAIFYQFFGLEGLKFANLFPFVIFVFSIFSLFKIFLFQKDPDFSSKKHNLFSLLPVVLFLSSLPLAIFYKFTLSEIWFGSLLWMAIYLTAVYFFSQRNRAVYYLTFLPLLLFPLSRIEGPIILFMFLLFFILEDSVNLKKVEYQMPFAILTGLFFLTILWEPNFFINALKGVAEPLIPGQESISILKEKNFWPDDWKNFYLAKIFFTYNLWPFWLMMFASVFVLLKNFWKNLRAKNHLEFSLPLMPFFITLPALFYFWDANISLDHPWMLRRFLFALIPLAILYTAFFLKNIFQKSVFVFYFLVVALFLTNFSLFYSSEESLNNLIEKEKNSEEFAPKEPLNFFIYDQNENLLAQLKHLDWKIQPQEKDLILISQKASGSGWSMLAEPWRNILHRQAVYFFNPNDLEKIDKDNFSRIFLVISENEEPLYEKIEKEKFTDYTLKNNLILPSREALAAPQGLDFEVKGNVYLIK